MDNSVFSVLMIRTKRKEKKSNITGKKREEEGILLYIRWLSSASIKGRKIGVKKKEKIEKSMKEENGEWLFSKLIWEVYF